VTLVDTGGLVAELVVRRGGGFTLDLGLAIEPGTTTALLGPNGAGKSTAVAAIAGLLPLDAGRLGLAGSILDDPAAGVFVPPEARRIGVVFQDYLLFPHLTAIENVAFGLRSRGVPRGEAHDRAAEWLGRLGLRGAERIGSGDLSGGQAQRVALARALVTDPDLLLLDEPLAALDVTTRAALRRTLGEHLAAFAGPRLLITHDPTEAFLLADRVHVLEAGTVTQAGTPADIRLRPRTAYAADLGGTNLVLGTAAGGLVDTGERTIAIADHSVAGPVLVTIRPSSITIHRRPPEGSPRNSWATTIETIEHLGGRVRLQTSPPVPLTAEITEEAAKDLELGAGTGIWVAIKATEVAVEPAGD
jgi:molybdate transport system ATP-binding protein